MPLQLTGMLQLPLTWRLKINRATCSWNIRFISDVNDWELVSVDSNIPSSEGPAFIWLTLNGNGRFDVHSHSALKGLREVMFPWKSIWRAKAPKRITFLCGQQHGPQGKF